MKIIYSPTYSTFKDCPIEYVEYLSKKLAHYIDKDTLTLFSNNCRFNFAATKQYLFKATKNSNNTFDVFLYSGFVARLLKEIYESKTIIDIKNLEIVSTRSKYVCSNNIISTILRPHQKEIVETCLLKKRGIIKAPTSSGKSFCIAELIRKFSNDKLKVLVVVSTINLLYQMARDINEYLALNNLPELELGSVGDGSYDFKDITIGISNSLSNITKTKEYLKSVDVLLLDECHLHVNPTFLSIIEEMTHRCVSLAFSATPEVAGPAGVFLEGFFGPRISTISESELIEQNIILQPRFCFYTVPKGFLPQSLIKDASNIVNLNDAHRYKILPLVYNYLIINNEGRNNIIINKTIEEINKKRGPVIIIVNKVKGEGNHADILSSLLLEQGINFPIISGYISKKKREQIINDLKNNSILGVIAGPKVLTAGINIPSLSSIVLAAAGKSNNDFIQRVGRLLRKKEGKESPTVIDFLDTQYWFKNQSRERIKVATNIYGKENIEIL